MDIAPADAAAGAGSGLASLMGEAIPLLGSGKVRKCLDTIRTEVSFETH